MQIPGPSPKLQSGTHEKFWGTATTWRCNSHQGGPGLPTSYDRDSERWINASGLHVSRDAAQMALDGTPLCHPQTLALGVFSTESEPHSPHL